MCGIAGLVNWGDVAALRRMTEVQRHRGPDDHGIAERQRADGAFVGLGSRRLAILDLSPAGHMPMVTDDGRFTITYNGEIYNYPALRRELESAGHQFRSHSDTELVLQLYARHGTASLSRLNGMFAVAIWDRDRDELFLARDHFGIKPLYYSVGNDRLAFASEVKALLQVPDCPRALDVETLHQYLTFLWVPEPGTLFKGIRKLPAGHYALFRSGQLSLHEYWDLRYPDASAIRTVNEAGLSQELRERLTCAVKRQLLSDVPVGAFLSAGLDSSSIVAAMAGAHNGRLRTYTISFPRSHLRGETTFDDPEVAARTAAHFGAEHTEIRVEPRVAELLPQLVWHLDDPVADPAVITAYLVAREARPTSTVLLSGVGGDELFAGYRKHVAHSLARRYRRLPGAMRRVAERGAMALPPLRGTPLKGHVRLLQKMARSASLPPIERFLTDSTYMSDAFKTDLYMPDIAAATAAVDPWAEHQTWAGRIAHADPLDQMLYIDAKTFMPSLNLLYNDKMSMAASIEARVPFLDVELVEWVVANVPPRMKLRGLTTKYVLRKAMAPVLPAEVLRQKKAGFAAPLDRWLARDLQPMVDDLLSVDAVKRRGLFRPDTIRRLVDEHRRGTQDWSYQVWQLLVLELWQRTFLDAAA
jgi:asparagine synthase (glutamine-hydrolysing)